ncbi:hypothetical protein SBA2_100027 [Acidobacteriia bacterium SbA2]|nr:hypothetical protein SBA2_100027 [Acidobacteriia bacterium SbA2]
MAVWQLRPERDLKSTATVQEFSIYNLQLTIHHSLFRIALQLPLNLREDSAQDFGVVVCEFEIAHQASQFQQCGAAALGLQVSHLVQYTRGTLEQVLQGLRASRVRRVNGGPEGPCRNKSGARELVSANRHRLSQIHGWAIQRSRNTNQRVAKTQVLVRKAGLLGTEEQGDKTSRAASPEPGGEIRQWD